MPELEITKTVQYTDPDTLRPYDLTATIKLQATLCYRDNYVLDATTAKRIIITGTEALFSGDVKYAFIKNVGDNSAYIGIHAGGAAYSIIEIPPGCDHDFFGKNISNSISSPDPTMFDKVEAKGNTTIEVDVFV